MNIYERRYGSLDPIYFYMWAPDGTALQAGADLDAGDFQISKDGGSFANVTGTFAAIASGLYRYTPVAADHSCKVAAYKFVDADTAVLDKPLIVETYGHPSAMHPFRDVPIFDIAGFGVPQAVASGAVTLPATAPATAGYYNALVIADGPGVGQLRYGAYSATRVFTPTTAWATAPTTSSLVYPLAADSQSAPLDAAGIRAALGMSTTDLPSEIQAELEEDGASILDTLRDRLTASRATALDELEAANLPADVDSLLSRLTTARAGYLDNLNVGGNVASSAEVTSIQNNTRVVRVVPSVIERPDSGTTTYRIELFIYDELGNMEAPDSAPTIELVDQGGTDLSSRLDSATMTLVETGRYRAIYTASDSDDLEQLVWTFSVVEGGATRKYGNGSLIVDTTAVDFTSADRTLLTTIEGKVIGTIASGTHNPQSGDAFARLGVAGAGLTDVGGLSVGAMANVETALGAYGAAKPGDDMDISGVSQSALVNALLDGALSGHTTAGTVGKAIIDILADTNDLQGDDVPGLIAALDVLINEILTKLPAATVDGLTPTQLMATLLASAAGRIPDKNANPMIIQNPAGTQTRISSTTDRAAVTLDHTGV